MGNRLLCSRPPPLPWGWGRSWGWHLAVGLGTALVGTVSSTLGHRWSLWVTTDSPWQGLWGDRGCDIPLALPRHPGVPAGLACPTVGGGTRAGPHSCCDGTGTGTNTAGGRDEGAGTARGWHTLLQELGHWDRAWAARVAGHSCPLPARLSPQPVTLRPRAKCHHPSGDTASAPSPPGAAAAPGIPPALPDPGGSHPPVPSRCHT